MRLFRAKTLESVYVRVCSVASVISDSAALWTVAHRAPLSRGLSRQEDGNGLPLLPPRDLPDPGVESESPASPVHCRQILYC